MYIISLNETDRTEVNLYIKDAWDGPYIITLGNRYDSRILPGFAAYMDGRLAGAILYRMDNGKCEISVLFSHIQSQGIGTALIRKVIETAKVSGCRRVWLVTSNDNTRAIRFYQMAGFDLKKVHINSFDIIRKFKKELPENGVDGIPLKHEFEFEWLL